MSGIRRFERFAEQSMELAARKEQDEKLKKEAVLEARREERRTRKEAQKQWRLKWEAERKRAWRETRRREVAREARDLGMELSAVEAVRRREARAREEAKKEAMDGVEEFERNLLRIGVAKEDGDGPADTGDEVDEAAGISGRPDSAEDDEEVWLRTMAGRVEEKLPAAASERYMARVKAKKAENERARLERERRRRKRAVDTAKAQSEVEARRRLERQLARYRAESEDERAEAAEKWEAEVRAAAASARRRALAEARMAEQSAEFDRALNAAAVRAATAREAKADERGRELERLREMRLAEEAAKHERHVTHARLCATRIVDLAIVVALQLESRGLDVLPSLQWDSLKSAYCGSLPLLERDVTVDDELQLTRLWARGELASLASTSSNTQLAAVHAAIDSALAPPPPLPAIPAHAMRLAVIGPPSSGRSTLAAALAARFKFTVLTPPADVLQAHAAAVKAAAVAAKEAARAASRASEAVDASKEDDEPPPPLPLVAWAADAAAAADSGSGWLLDVDWPEGAVQLAQLQTLLRAAGCPLDVVLQMEGSEDTLLARVAGLRVDPATGVRYGAELPDDIGKDVKRRLQAVDISAGLASWAEQRDDCARWARREAALLRVQSDDGAQAAAEARLLELQAEKRDGAHVGWRLDGHAAQQLRREWRMLSDSYDSAMMRALGDVRDVISTVEARWWSLKRHVWNQWAIGQRASGSGDARDDWAARVEEEGSEDDAVEALEDELWDDLVQREQYGDALLARLRDGLQMESQLSELEQAYLQLLNTERQRCVRSRAWLGDFLSAAQWCGAREVEEVKVDAIRERDASWAKRRDELRRSKSARKAAESKAEGKDEGSKDEGSEDEGKTTEGKEDKEDKPADSSMQAELDAILSLAMREADAFSAHSEPIVREEGRVLRERMQRMGSEVALLRSMFAEKAAGLLKGMQAWIDDQVARENEVLQSWAAAARAAVADRQPVLLPELPLPGNFQPAQLLPLVEELLGLSSGKAHVSRRLFEECTSRWARAQGMDVDLPGLTALLDPRDGGSIDWREFVHTLLCNLLVQQPTPAELAHMRRTFYRLRPSSATCPMREFDIVRLWFEGYDELSFWAPQLRAVYRAAWTDSRGHFMHRNFLLYLAFDMGSTPLSPLGLLRAAQVVTGDASPAVNRGHLRAMLSALSAAGADEVDVLFSKLGQPAGVHLPLQQLLQHPYAARWLQPPLYKLKDVCDVVGV